VKILITADPLIPVPPAGYGGIERIVDALVRAYRSSGHAVGLVAHRDSSCACDFRRAWPSDGSGSLRDALALWRAAREFGPDVLHSFSRLGYLLPLLPGRLPKVMSYQRHTGGRQVSWAARLGGRSIAFTGCSDFICAMGRGAGGDWRTVHNFVEIEKFPFVPSRSADAPLLFLSRVESIKGPDVAIEIARLSGRRLIIAGNRAESGAERAFWDSRIAPFVGRGGVEWVGEVNDERKIELLGRAAALVVPIRWDEPFGIVFAEALAMGTPVITCARGAAPEVVDEGKTGFFIGSAAEGAAAAGRIGQIDPLACRRAAEARFSRDVCAGQYLSLFGELMQR
jgi:glycosyltransferase involved in cell wall biosynthesis